MLAQDLAADFPPVVRARGRDYVREGAVAVQERSPRGLRAVVSGTVRYQVTVRPIPDGIAGNCSCPYFHAHGPCKHLWAVLLVAERNGGLAALTPGLPGPRFVDGSTPEVMLRVRRARPTSPGVAVSDRTPSWAMLFEAPPAVPGAGPAGLPPVGRDRELHYVIDLEATREEGRFRLKLLERAPRRDGAPGALRPVQVTGPDLEALSSETDRTLVALLRGVEGWTSVRVVPAGGALAPLIVPSSLSLPDELVPTVLPLAAATGRLRLSLPGEPGEPRPLAYDGGPPWELLLALEPDDEGQGHRVEGRLQRDGETMDLAIPLVLTMSGWLLLTDRVARFEAFGLGPMVKRLRQRLRFDLPAGEESAFLTRLFALPSLPRLRLPPALALAEVSEPPQPQLRLEATGSGRSSLSAGVAAELSFRYGDVVVLPNEVRLALADPAARVVRRRDRAAEADAVTLLRELGVDAHAAPWAPGGLALEVAPRQVPALVRALLARGWHVEADGRVYRRAGKLATKITSGIDWFDVTAAIDFDGLTASLPALLGAASADGTVVLSDGSVGLLPEDWLDRFGLLARLGAEEGEALRFKASQAMLLDAWLADEPAVTCDERFLRARQELARFEGVERLPAPPGFAGALRPYQEHGLGWMAFLRRFGFGGCLADDMGLGKTVQVLAMLEERRAEGRGPSLVVVPKSLVWNWVAEAQRFTPELRVLAHVGIDRGRDAEALADKDLVLTTYGTLKNDLPLLRRQVFDYVVLDEAQAIKNAGSATAKAVRLLRGENRLALSGTPVENHLGELGSLFEFLNPGLLGGASALKDAGAGKLGPEAVAALGRALRPFILRRTKEQVAPELPAKHEETIICEMEPGQRRLYGELREHYRASVLTKIDRQGLARSKMHVLEALLRLRQAACHPGLVDRARAAESSAKLDVLLPRLDEVRQEGHKALVFSQFTSLLSLVRSRLDRDGVPYEYLDGSTSDRQERVERFQSDPACPFFLLSLKAGGVGLNLTAADYVFILDPWWNPAAEAQAVDRAHRIGQDKQVFVYRLLCKDTVEEKIAALQASKRALAEAVVSAENGFVQRLDRETLDLLLS